MSKFNFDKTIDKVQKSLGKDQRRAVQFGVGDNLERMSDNDEDYVLMPDWWQESYAVRGLPFGKWVQVSGRPDAGKTTISLEAIRRAQEQGYAVLYVETEGKTGESRLLSSGIDPKQMMTIRSKITEEIFDGINRTVDAFFDEYPDAKLLLVVDSYGNTVSQRDSELDMTSKNQQPGGAAKSNRLGLGAIAARQIEHDIAVLIVNYSYANLGSVGETNAGGRALEFFCSLIINASRKSWYERTVNKVKVRAGADVKWVTTKNHFALEQKDAEGNLKLYPKELILRISSEGINLLQANAKETADEDAES